MTLSEKITALRGERKLSQGDLAERMDVSRQSVSKWETGQAVPELDKIIKLADLFGISVDELVRDEDMPKADTLGPETPRPETVKTEVTEKIVYIEKPRAGLTPIQILGAICAASGAALALLALFFEDPELVIVGMALFFPSLPLLLAKKHPFLISGWLIWPMGYLTLCNPYLSGALGGPWQPFVGIFNSLRWLMHDGSAGGSILALGLFFLLSYSALSVLTVLLPVYSGWLGWKKWKGWKQRREKNAAE